MRQGPAGEQQVHPPLECSSLVYRLARKRSDLNPDTNELSPAVFIRQEHYDDQGLSVVIEDAVPLEQVCTSERYARRCYGVATLHVGRLRDHMLEVEPDDFDHANVTGVPYPSDEPQRAESLSRWLAKHARTVWRRP